MQQNKGRVYYGRFVQREKLSQGSFGVVYICHDKVTRDYVAIKVEKENKDVMSLEREIQIIEELRGITGVPKLYWYGNEYNQNCMAMQLLGKDLAHFQKKFKKLSLKTVCNLAEQLLIILEEIHKRGVIHRDIKPENILMGRGNDSQQVYMVDFGISKKFRNNNQHIPFQENKPFIGTTRYASISAHKGQELSRKDDLESLGYVFIYLLRGNLPWQNITSSSDKEKTKLVGKFKMELELKDLCKGLPIEFQKYLDYVYKLKFASTPDYQYLLGLFQRIAKQNNISFDRKFDWMDNQTTSTKSSDQAQQSSNEIDISNLQSDYLKLKKSEKRKSFQIDQNSQQSSVVLNYAPSIVQFIYTILLLQQQKFQFYLYPKVIIEIFKDLDKIQNNLILESLHQQKNLWNRNFKEYFFQIENLEILMMIIKIKEKQVLQIFLNLMILIILMMKQMIMINKYIKNQEKLELQKYILRNIYLNNEMIFVIYF